MGLIGAVSLWYLGGWWYNLRVRWSGVPSHDKRQGRLIYIYSGLVEALPSLSYALLATAIYANYQAAWDAEELWSSLLLVFPFWSVVVSYRGVRTSFPVKPWPARLWFLILPSLMYVFAFGLLGVAYALLTNDSSAA
jgi:hypothetical protein